MFFEDRLRAVSSGGWRALAGDRGFVRRACAVAAVVGTVAAASVYSIAGPVPAASALTAPAMVLVSLQTDTVIIHHDDRGETGLVALDLTMKQGESRRLIGNTNATMTKADFGTRNMADVATLRCFLGGVQQGIAATAEQGIRPGETKTLRPTLLFKAPLPGVNTYTCHLAAETGSTVGHVEMTVHKSLTNLSASAADEVDSHMWQNRACDSAGTLSTCTYLGKSGGPTQRFILDNDGTPLSPWAAGPTATSINVLANVELTECGHTASCGGTKGDASTSTVSSYLDVVQLDTLGNACNETHTAAQTDVIGIYQHHYSIAYNLPNVPVLACGGSRNFKVRVSMRWVSGNAVKIDGSREDPLAQTNAVAINANYTNPVLARPTLSNGKVILAWVDHSTNEDAFQVYRVAPTGLIFSDLVDLRTPNKAGRGETITFVDNTPVDVANLRCYKVVAYDNSALFNIGESDIMCVSS